MMQVRAAQRKGLTKSVDDPRANDEPAFAERVRFAIVVPLRVRKNAV